MPFDQSSHSCGRPSYAATLPTRQVSRFTVSQLMSAVRKILAGTSMRADLDLALTADNETHAFPRLWGRPKCPPTIGLSVGGVTVAVTGHDRAAFEAEDLVRLDVDGWPGGRAEIVRCIGHVEVSEIRAAAGREVHSGFDRASVVTLVATAVSHLVDSVGVVWHASLVSLRSSDLPVIASKLTAGQPPASLWLGTSPFSERDGQPAGVMTRGLYPVLGGEIGIGDTRMPRSVSLEIIMGLAKRIIMCDSLLAHDTRATVGSGQTYHVGHFPRGGELESLKVFLVPEAASLVAGAA